MNIYLMKKVLMTINLMKSNLTKLKRLILNMKNIIRLLKRQCNQKILSSKLNKEKLLGQVVLLIFLNLSGLAIRY